MFTIEYKGLYIHGYFDKTECRVCFASGSTLGEFRSYRAAQLAISKFLNLAGQKTRAEQ